MNEGKLIYMDHAATCPMRPEALRAMQEALETVYGNASPTYPPGQQAKARLDEARGILADSIGAKWGEIFFTSGGTESDNWALIGAAEAMQERGRHIVASGVEHHAVLHTCAYLESRGFTVTYLPVDSEGIVRPEILEQALNGRDDTILVSVMTVNNEVGTIQPVDELCKIAHAHGALFHTDAVQAYGKLPILVHCSDEHDLLKQENATRTICVCTERLNMNIDAAKDASDRDICFDPDLLSVSAHKIGGPKGIGFLYIRKGVQIGALIHGGMQEMGRRAGTENVPAAIGFAAAANLVAEECSRGDQPGRERQLQEYFLRELERAGIRCVLNGPVPGPQRIPNNISLSFPGLEAQSVLMNLDLMGICASGGSACTTGAPEPSHVIMAMNGDTSRAKGTIRFTLGQENTEEEIDTVIRALKEITMRLYSL